MIPPPPARISRSKPNQTSLGASYTNRNAPTVINAAYSPVWQFWDGRADSLWSQALSPPEGTAECAGSRLKVVHVLFENYQEEFEGVFGSRSLALQHRDDARHRHAGEQPGSEDEVHARRRDRAVQRRLRLSPERRRQAGREPRLRKLRQGDRRLRAPADRATTSTRHLSIGSWRETRRRCHRRRSAARGCSSDTPDAPSATADRCSPITRSTTSACPQTGQYVPTTDLGRVDGISKLVTTDPNVVRFDRSSDFSDKTGRRLPARARNDGPELGDGASSRRRRCGTSARPPPTCTTALTRRCGRS